MKFAVFPCPENHMIRFKLTDLTWLYIIQSDEGLLYVGCDRFLHSVDHQIQLSIVVTKDIFDKFLTALNYKGVNEEDIELENFKLVNECIFSIIPLLTDCYTQDDPEPPIYDACNDMFDLDFDLDFTCAFTKTGGYIFWQQHILEHISEHITNMHNIITNCNVQIIEPKEPKDIITNGNVQIIEPNDIITNTLSAF